MIKTIITVLISLVVGGGIAGFFVWKSNKEKTDALLDIGKSQANDKPRSDLINKAKEQIKKNKEVVKNAKETISNNNG